MDQIKIGSFIKKLRNEKGITQEEFAEALNTSRRSVSRWETGTNMPDLDVIPEIAEYFGVSINELFMGERKQLDFDEAKQTFVNVANYAGDLSSKNAKVMCIYFILGLMSIVINQILFLIKTPESFILGFCKGATFGLTVVSMIVGLLYSLGKLNKYKQSKRKIFEKIF